MCAILDANSVSEVFGEHQTDAGRAFHEWITSGQGVLVVGGKLSAELERGWGDFRKWSQQASRAGNCRIIPAERVKKFLNSELKNLCGSNDIHIIALARASGVRLLYTKDKRLRDDFGSWKIVNKPRGRVYWTGPPDNRNKAPGFVPGHLTSTHKALLNSPDLCPRKASE